MNMTNKVQEYSNDNSEIKSKYIAQDVESGERTETVKVTKEEVFDEIPTLVAFCMKLIGLLEPKNNCRRVSFTWFCRLICILCFNFYFIPLQINEENATPFIATYTYQSIPYGLYICWLTASIHSLCYKLIMKGYINDLIFFWRVMLPADKQNLSKFIKTNYWKFVPPSNRFYYQCDTFSSWLSYTWIHGARWVVALGWYWYKLRKDRNLLMLVEC